MKTIAEFLVNAVVIGVIILIIYQFIKNKMWKDLFILVAVTITLTACTKPIDMLPGSIKPKPPAKMNTIPDNSYIKLQLTSITDTLQSDMTVVVYNRTASALYVPGEDAPYFAGFGGESLSSLSGNGIPLAINYQPGTSVKLLAGSKKGGSYVLSKVSGTLNIDGLPLNLNLAAGVDMIKVKLKY